MGKKKQLVINLVANIISFAVSMGISFFLTPFIVKNVGVDAYGFIGLANSFISYASLFTVALNSMAGRFITISIHREEYEDVKKYFVSVFLANLVMAIPLTFLGVFLILRLEHIVHVPLALVFDVKLLWIFLFLNFIVGLLGNVFSVATFSQNRLDLDSLRKIESNLIRVVVLVVTFFFFKPSVWYVGFATFVCGIYVICINLYYTKRFLPYVEFRKKYLAFSKIKQLLFSGIWNTISQLSSILTTGLDLLISNIFVGAEAMGVVSIAKTIPIHVRNLFYSVGSVFAPNLTIAYAHGDYEEMREQLISSVRLLGFLASIPIAVIFAYSKDFYVLWTPNQNSSLLQVLSIMEAFAMPLSLSLEPLYHIFTVSNKVKQSSLVSCGAALLSSVLTFILLRFVQTPELKLCVIVGTSTMVGVLRVSLFVPLYGAKCLKQRWTVFYPIMGRVIIASAITVGLSFVIRYFVAIQSWLELLLAICLTAILSLVVNYFYMLRREERQILLRKLRRRKEEQ